MLKIIVIHIVFASCQYLPDRRPTVQLKQGSIVGVKVYGDVGKVVDAFLGIPYATSPTNNLRFAPPKKHSGWNGTLQAIEYGSQCPQLPISNKNSEDCLRLNIWTPENSIRNGPKSVVIFFEGIEFQKSAGVPIPGQELAMEDIIVVTANYRLNIFGFLCLGIPEARGNLGLLDQYFAILWVKENIRYFGGDPEKITLFGYSSGAASVILHMTSPRTFGLYQRTIISSGSPLSPWHITDDPFAASKKISSLLGCYNKEPKMVLKCLQSKSVYDILKTYESYVEMGNAELFLPIVDDFLPENDKYLPNKVENALQRDTRQQVPIMIGISKKISDAQYNKWVELANQGLLHLQQYAEHIKIPEIIRKYKFETNANKAQIIELLKWRFMSSSDVQMLLKQLKNLDFEAKVEAPLYSLLSTLEISYIGPLYVYNLEDMGIALNSTGWLYDYFLRTVYNTVKNKSLFVKSNDNIRTYSIIWTVVIKPTRKEEVHHKGVQNKFESEIMCQEFHYFWLISTLYYNIRDPTPMNENKWKRYTSSDSYIENFQTNHFEEDDEIIYRNRRISFWTSLLQKISQKGTSFTTTPREFAVIDPTASFRHAMYTLVGLVIALLTLLGICIVLLKKRYKERERNFHMGY